MDKLKNPLNKSTEENDLNKVIEKLFASLREIIVIDEGGDIGGPTLRGATTHLVLALLSVGQIFPKPGNAGDLEGVEPTESLSSCIHTLLEAPPGLGKTLLGLTLASFCGLSFKKIQFTSDLLPIDILGYELVKKDAQGEFVSDIITGPIFANVVLADEINRGQPKTHSALLEVMAESKVTFPHGLASKELMRKIPALPTPFFVIATENPIEQEGTYSLPEAVLDRFGQKILIPYPEPSTLVEISKRQERFAEKEIFPIIDKDKIQEIRNFISKEIFVPDNIRLYAAFLVTLGRQPRQFEIERLSSQWPKFSEIWHKLWFKEKFLFEKHEFSIVDLIKVGISPRAVNFMISLAKSLAFIRGRKCVEIEDVQKVQNNVLRHRIILSAQAEGLALDFIDGRNGLIEEILKIFKERVPIP